MNVVDWSEIPKDLMTVTARHLHTVIDYMNTSQVCKAWKSSTFSSGNLTIPTNPPFLMLAKSNNQHLQEFVEFSSDSSVTKVYNLYLPEIYQSKCIGSIGNWLILIPLDLQICIFNPFTKNQLQFQFPSQSTLPYQSYAGVSKEQLGNRFIQKVILSSPDSEIIGAMVFYGLKREIAIARPGDESWTTIPVAAADDAIFFKGAFYSVHSDGVIIACYIEHRPPRTYIIDFLKNLTKGKYYLVEWLGRLVIVARLFVEHEENPFYETKGFEVYLYDIDKRECKEFKNLGQHSLFLGLNTSVSLLASDDSLFRGNCIYFTDDYRRERFDKNMESGHDMGVFDLDDGTIKPLCDGICTCRCSPPVWIIPTSIC